MSDFIRMYGLKMSHKGVCNKCGDPTDKGNHRKCYRWPVSHGCAKGFTYVANARETSLAELKAIVAAICAGDDDETPVRFEIKIMQTRNCDEVTDDK
jgi:hypothetical protein